MNLSIIIAAVPSLHRSIADLHSGHIGTRIPESHMELTASEESRNKSRSGKNFTNPLNSHNQSKGGFRNFTTPSANRSQTGREGRDEKDFADTWQNSSRLDAESDDHFRPGMGGSMVRVEHDPNGEADTNSRASDGSEKMIIKQTVAWDVRYEDE